MSELFDCERLEEKPAYAESEMATEASAGFGSVTDNSPRPLFAERWKTITLGQLEHRGDIGLYRGKVISQKDIDRMPGDYPIYSSSVHDNGLFGSFGDYMFDEELITWSVDGGGHFFYRPKHRFSVTNVCGYLRIHTSSIDYRYLAYHLQELHSRKAFDYTLKAHPSVIRGAYRVALPPLSEQHAIAAALSDVDELIGSLEALIAKKRAIKQAAMQELLTGRTRFPGFGGEWEAGRLGELAKLASGGTPSTSVAAYWSGGIPWITGADIADQSVAKIRRHITKEAVERSATSIVAKGDLLIVSRTGVGKLAIAPCDIAISQDFTGVIPNRNKLGSRFLFRYLDFRQHVLANQNQGTSIKGITRDALAEVFIPLPPLPEQRAIAAILSDMDSEIAALEQRLDKTRAIKQGMMQQLLTGSIRLPISDVDTETDDAHDA